MPSSTITSVDTAYNVSSVSYSASGALDASGALVVDNNYFILVNAIKELITVLNRGK